jgi:hypothetical protein
MLVLNKMAHIITQGIHVFQQDKEGAQVAVPNKMKKVVLKPGANEVDDALWEKCKKSKIVAFYVENGDLVEQDSRPLSKRPESSACALVKQTWDPEMLARWHQDDERPAVRKAISDQIKQCTLTDEDRKKLKDLEKDA